MEEHKCLFPFKDQKMNLKARGTIQELTEKFEDSIKKRREPTSNSMDEN